MSFRRLLGRHAAWAAAAGLAGWALAEGLGRLGGEPWRVFGEGLTCGLVGGLIGGALGFLSGLDGSRLRSRAAPIAAGLAAGGIAGGIGGSLGHAFLGALPGSRELGWAILGGGIGAAEGLYLRAPLALRRGGAAGALGGLAGGLSFALLYPFLSGWTEPGGRALCFAALGASVGGLVGLARFGLARSWLAFEDGRRVPLEVAALVLGKSGGSALGVATGADTQAEPDHARVVRRPDGRYFLEDLRSRGGTFVNQRRIASPVVLNHGDLIGIGSGSIRFHSRTPASTTPTPATTLLTSTPTHSPTSTPTPATNSAPIQRTPPKAPLPNSTAPTPTAQRPTQSSPSPRAAPTPKKESQVSQCPQCKQFVLGKKPYCNRCKISF